MINFLNIIRAAMTYTQAYLLQIMYTYILKVNIEKNIIFREI